MTELFKSKKFIVSLIGLIVVIAGHFGLELDEVSLVTIVSPIIAYIIGQGMSDLGKEKAKIENEPKMEIAKNLLNMKEDDTK